MAGVIFSIIAGMAMSVQGVMNTRLGEGIGTMHANAFVQGTAFALALLTLFFSKDGSFSALAATNRLYWCGGVLGIVITVTVMLAIKSLSPTLAISVILISQLLVAAAIDALGLMGTEKMPFGICKYIGLAMMIAGVVVFKWRS